MFNQLVHNLANLLHLLSLRKLQFAKIGGSVHDKCQTEKLITTKWEVSFFFFGGGGGGQFFGLLKFYFEVSFPGQNPAIKNFSVTLLHEQN
jgi:hypothetical protein